MGGPGSGRKPGSKNSTSTYHAIKDGKIVNSYKVSEVGYKKLKSAAKSSGYTLKKVK